MLNSVFGAIDMVTDMKNEMHVGEKSVNKFSDVSSTCK